MALTIPHRESAILDTSGEPARPRRMVRRCLSPLARLTVKASLRPKLNWLQRQLAHSQTAQQDWLLQRVRALAETDFGRDHGLASVQTVGDFRRAVPVGDYERFAPYVQRVAAGESRALVPPQDRLLRFTITTGTTGVPKLNPVTETWLREYKRSWEIWGLKLFADHPRYVGSQILQLAGSWDMGHTPGGHSISMVSALLAREQSPLLKPFFSVPAILNEIADPVARYYAALRLSVLQDVGWIILMNPGTLVRLAQISNDYAQTLVRDLADGTLTTEFEFPAAVREALAPRIRQRRVAGARWLDAVRTHAGALYPRHFWDDPVVACWLGGTAGFQIRHVPEYFGAGALRDMGLVSSEGRHTIPLDDGEPAGVLAVGAGYYEFIPREELTSATPRVLEGHELEVGADYSLVMTTSAGFTRFRIGDVVRCQGFHGTAPKLEFRHKEGRVGDLEGEKVTEHQVLEAAHQAAADTGLQLSQFTALPVRLETDHPRYDFLVELTDVPDSATARRLLSSVDQRLAQISFLWRARRNEGVLAAPRLVRLAPGSWVRYVSEETARRHTGDFQFKHPGLVLEADWLRQFSVVDVVTMTTAD